MANVSSLANYYYLVLFSVHVFEALITEAAVHG